MSRRAQRLRTARSASGAGGRGGKWMVRMVMGLVVIVTLTGFGVYAWLKSYLHSDDFRLFVGDAVSEVMGADAQFELFEWQGMHAKTAGFSAKNGGVVRRVTANDVQGNVSLAGASRGVWEIPDVWVGRLDAVVDMTYDDHAGGSTRFTRSASEPEADSMAETDKKSGFLDGLLPDKAELSSVNISNFNLKLQTTGGELRATDVAMKIDGGSQQTYGVHLIGGIIDVPWLDSPLHLQTARGKYKGGHMFLTESRSEVYEHGLLTLKGEMDKGRYAFYGVLTDVKSEEVVPEDWQKRITGDLLARCKVRSTKRGAVTRGEVELKKGVLTALPVLDRIAAYANTQRFRRLNLSDARLKFHQEEGRLDLSDIVITSEGLVRVLGALTVVDGRLDGRFRVGIMPGTLAHIPGAETKVFLRGEKGLLWAPLRITGTVDHPEEDLSARMIAAAGERMFELVPETGERALKFAQKTAAELPQNAIDAGSEVIDEGAELIHEGTDIIREGVGGVLDLIPGVGSSKDDD